MDGCLANLLKYLLFGSNFVIFVIGCVVLGLGIYALVDGASLVNLVDESGVGDDINITAFTSAAYIFIVVAVFVVILTFFRMLRSHQRKQMYARYLLYSHFSHVHHHDRWSSPGLLNIYEHT